MRTFIIFDEYPNEVQAAQTTHIIKASNIDRWFGIAKEDADMSVFSGLDPLTAEQLRAAVDSTDWRGEHPVPWADLRPSLADEDNA